LVYGWKLKADKDITMRKKIFSFFYRYLERMQFTVEEKIVQHGGTIGSGVFFGKDVLIDYDYAFLLEIEDGAVISARTIIELHDSSLPNVLGRGKLKVGRVKIGRNAYVGVNSVILPGIKIGQQAVVGACSLVNCDIPPREVWGGIPVRFISTIDALVVKRQTADQRTVDYFDWIGEVEKKRVDYPKLKEDFLRDVRRAFELREQAPR
jgi:maltose O-acetyltransferase